MRLSSYWRRDQRDFGAIARPTRCCLNQFTDSRHAFTNKYEFRIHLGFNRRNFRVVLQNKKSKTPERVRDVWFITIREPTRPTTMPIDPPPATIYSDFAALNAKQLRAAQEEIWAWISEAESAPYDDAPDDDLVDTAREALNEIIAERRMLHGDETAPRGG